MKKTQILSLRPYLKGSYIIGIGTTAICYLMKDKRVLKVFMNTSGKDYLFNKYENIIDHFERINELKNKTYVVPEELLIKDKECVAYIYDYINSRTLKHIRLSTKIDSLLCGYDRLVEDTEEISNKGFCLYDLHDKNILFNGDYHIIDLDKGTFEGIMTKETLLKVNMFSINKTILYSLFSVNYYKDMGFYNLYLRDSYYKNIIKSYNNMREFLNDLKEQESNIKTVFDAKINSNRLVYKEDNYYRHF